MLDNSSKQPKGEMKSVSIQCGCGEKYEVEIPANSQIILCYNAFYDQAAPNAPWTEELFVNKDGKDTCEKCGRKILYGWSEADNISYYSHCHPMERLIMRLSRNSWGAMMIGSTILAIIFSLISTIIVLLARFTGFLQWPDGFAYTVSDPFSNAALSVFWTLDTIITLYITSNAYTRLRIHFGRLESLQPDPKLRRPISLPARFMYSGKVYYVGLVLTALIVVMVNIIIIPPNGGYWKIQAAFTNQWYVPLALALVTIFTYTFIVQLFGGIVASIFQIYLWHYPRIDLKAKNAYKYTKEFLDYSFNTFRNILILYYLTVLLDYLVEFHHTGDPAYFFTNNPGFMVFLALFLLVPLPAIYIMNSQALRLFKEKKKHVHHVTKPITGDESTEGSEVNKEYALIAFKKRKEQIEVEVRGPLVTGEPIHAELSGPTEKPDKDPFIFYDEFHPIMGIAAQFAENNRGKRIKDEDAEKKDLDLLNSFEHQMEVLGYRMFMQFFSSKEVYHIVKNALDKSLPMYFDAEGALASNPWELLHTGESGGDFLCLSTQIARTTTGEPPYHRWRPVRSVLIVGAAHPSPDFGLPDLSNVNEECKMIAETLRGFMKVKILLDEDAGIDNVERELMSGKYDAFHFSGHSEVASDPKFNFLAFSDGKLTAQDLGRFISFNRKEDPKKLDLQLIFLNSCSSGESRVRGCGASDLGGLARSLIAAGVPCVVAMQWAVSDKGARKFAHEFYSGLMNGKSPEKSVWLARRKIALDTKERDVAWAAPMIFLR